MYSIRKSLFSLVLLSITLFSFSQTRLFVEPEFLKYAGDHKTMAVLPFKTSISLRPKQLEKLKDGDLEKMEQDESKNIQRSMYSWFLKRKQQGKMWVEVQDVNTTNALLAKNGISYDNLYEYTSTDLAKILNVDAIINGNFETNKPMSDGASLALGLLVGFYGATNQAVINMFIYDSESGKVMVNYNKSVAGSVGSTSDQLINIIMRKASRRIPYTNPK